MIESCAVLRALVDRAHGKDGLSPDQARALIYSVGLVGKTPALAVEILAAAQAPMRELHRVQYDLARDAERSLALPSASSSARRTTSARS